MTQKQLETDEELSADRPLWFGGAFLGLVLSTAVASTLIMVLLS